MPRTAQTIANVNVRSHTFKFVTPALTDDFKIPNPCLSCHADRNTAWARQAMRPNGKYLETENRSLGCSTVDVTCLQGEFETACDPSGGRWKSPSDRS